MVNISLNFKTLSQFFIFKINLPYVIMSIHYVPSDSFENISLLAESVAPLKVDIFPQPCLLNGDDISYISSVDQMQKFSNLEIANKMLTNLIEVENRLQSSLSTPSSDSRKAQEFNETENLFQIHGQNDVSSKIYCLPFIHMDDLPTQNSNFSNNFNFFQSLFGSYQTEFSAIISSQLKHPLEDKIAFSNSISKICHLCSSVKTFLNIQPKGPFLLPIPNNPLFIALDGQKIYLNETASTPILFFQEMIEIAKQASILTHIPINFNIDLHTLNNILQVKSIQQINFSSWNSIIHEIQKLIQFFLSIIKVLTQEQ